MTSDSTGVYEGEGVFDWVSAQFLQNVCGTLSHVMSTASPTIPSDLVCITL